MTDLVERLRCFEHPNSEGEQLMQEAADTIEAIRAQVAELTKERDERKLFTSSLAAQGDSEIAFLKSERDIANSNYRILAELSAKALASCQAQNVQLREAIEEGLRTYKVPYTARIVEALATKEQKS